MVNVSNTYPLTQATSPRYPKDMAGKPERALLQALLDVLDHPGGDTPTTVLAGLELAGSWGPEMRAILRRRAGEAEESPLPEARDVLERLLTGRPVRLSTQGVTVRRDGAHLRWEPITDVAVDRFLLRLLHLIERVGVDRVRRCPLEGCGRWFVAHKRQLACTLAHAQRVRYLRWANKPRPRRKSR
jgi:hypothetical protein